MKTNNSILTSYLSFKIGDEVFAVNVSKVLNILEMTRITKVPKAPQYMKGVINLRGTVLPLVDIRMKFGLLEAEFTSNTCILVLDIAIDDKTVHIGGIVDGVQEVLEIEPNQILPPPNLGTSYHSDFISGMYKINDTEFLMILDIDKVFSTDEILHVHHSAQIE